jgi:hypothetical protein
LVRAISSAVAVSLPERTAFEDADGVQMVRLHAHLRPGESAPDFDHPHPVPLGKAVAFK